MWVKVGLLHKRFFQSFPTLVIPYFVTVDVLRASQFPDS